MANWFKDKKDEELPQELRGKTPEQVAAELKKVTDAEAKVAAMEADRATERQQVDTMKSEFEQVKTRLAAAEAKNTTPPKTPEELANFIEEPDKAFQQRQAPVLDLAVRTAISTSRMLAQQQLDNQDLTNGGKTMDGRLFRAWGAELDTEAKKYQPAMMTTPSTWIGIFYQLKGVHADELADPETRKKKYNFLEPSRQGAPPPPDKKDEDVLTDQEKHVADKMGVTHENYLKRKKSMQFVNA